MILAVAVVMGFVVAFVDHPDDCCSDQAVCQCFNCHHPFAPATYLVALSTTSCGAERLLTENTAIAKSHLIFSIFRPPKVA